MKQTNGKIKAKFLNQDCENYSFFQKYNKNPKMYTFSTQDIEEFLNTSKPGFRKHQIIQKYRENQKEKSILRNKLNILKSECLKYNRKTKSIESSLKKVNKIKQNYKIDKIQLQETLRIHQLKQEQKLKKVKQVKEENRGKLPTIMSWLQRQKSYDCLLVKKQSKAIEQKIRVYRNTIVSERKNTVKKIKQQQQMVPFNRTLYMQLKKRNARMHEEEEAHKIEGKFRRSRLQLEEMKHLEGSLLEKLNKSRTKLNQSMTKMHRGIRG